MQTVYEYLKENLPNFEDETYYVSNYVSMDHVYHLVKEYSDQVNQDWIDKINKKKEYLEPIVGTQIMEKIMDWMSDYS